MNSSPKTTIRASSSTESEHSALATISGPIPEGSPRVTPILGAVGDSAVLDEEWEVMNLGPRGYRTDAVVRDHKHLQEHLVSVTLITGSL